MPKNILSRARNRALTKQHKIAVAGVAALGTAAIALSAVPGNADTVTTGSPATAAQVAKVATQDATLPNVKGSVTDRAAAQSVKLDAIAAQQKAADQAAAKQRSDAAAKKAAVDAAAKKAAQERAAKQSANRSAQRPQMQDVAAKTYANNLDGWIRQSLDIMHAKGIPGSYNGLYRNIMRESSGNPMAINNWDINAINGIPSKGLLQVIQPTFNTYHVPGTSWNIYDPVANITAACNYAAHRYGSMDNVNSAY
ncbi:MULTISPECIES: transglycosylase SLT domain-containing protein [unclassified Streptomyces]|uniref:transglycosylase SLT domain-containing protein n=1 Tax=unclassified Streptomyces TaxID=2593676 RepID=UPI000DB9EEA3|nr:MULTISPECIES: transglycosylase SLT domain-containing protein [Streptomyces]MYU03464.1 transglycosylase SLT domain-containing protein [Streptomyces sp. SID8366]MYU66603.1 transglycosylase SLT domain-containing protein [Streptomyces sp. SID69]RAJ51521.1 transglycosylase-like protein with SLT domain [Streptomyces sp. PsTaAH-130]TXJ72632.1 lytic transglycosylase [Streptomyces lavendulae]